MKLKNLLGTILAISLMPSIAVAEMSLADKYEDLEIIYTQDLLNGDLDMPWSELIIAEDDFEGDYLAVLDREKVKGHGGFQKGAFSEWSKGKVKVYYYSSVKGMFGGGNSFISPAKTMMLKIGDSKFSLQGDSGTFEITPDIVNAIKANPNSVPKVKITPKDEGGFAGFSEMVYEIGEDTVDAWQYIYQDKEIALE